MYIDAGCGFAFVDTGKTRIIRPDGGSIELADLSRLGATAGAAHVYGSRMFVALAYSGGAYVVVFGLTDGSKLYENTLDGYTFGDDIIVSDTARIVQIDRGQVVKVAFFDIIGLVPYGPYSDQYSVVRRLDSRIIAAQPASTYDIIFMSGGREDVYRSVTDFYFAGNTVVVESGGKITEYPPGTSKV